MGGWAPPWFGEANWQKDTTTESLIIRCESSETKGGAAVGTHSDSVECATAPFPDGSRQMASGVDPVHDRSRDGLDRTFKHLRTILPYNKCQISSVRERHMSPEGRED